MKVILAEKPDQAAKLAAPFESKKGKGYIEVVPCHTFPKGAYFTWCVGHLFSLVNPEEYDPKFKTWSLDTLPILPEAFKYSIIKGKNQQFQIIKNLVNDSKVSEIILGTDCGREGEAIGRITINMAGVKKPMKRLWTSSLTKSAVVKAFQNLLHEQEKRGIYFEATARSYADWMVGINTSRSYSILLQKKGIKEQFSTGRVQTPLLALIVEREREIENFKPSHFWEVFADFNINGKQYRGKWFKKDQDRIDEKEKADALSDYCQGKPAQVKEVNVERKTFEPPMLFNLSALQITANKRYKYSPERVLEICQKLYMEEYLSYPRSESQHVTEEEATTFPDVLEKLSKQESYKGMIPTPVQSLIGNKRYVNSEEVSDHYAIIPTENVPNLNELSEEERSIYDLVAKSLIAAHYDKATFDYSSVITIIDEKFTFSTKGKALIQEGWRKIIYSNNDIHIEDEENKNDYAAIPSMNPNELGLTTNAECREGDTKPPKRYTQGDLIPLMKSGGKPLENEELKKLIKQTEGLGTEATRASIIKTLKDREYIEVRKNIVYSSDKGRILIDAIGNSILTSAELTAQWEKRLREIGAGQASHANFIEQAKQLTKKLVEEAIANLSNSNLTLQLKESDEQKEKDNSHNKSQEVTPPAPQHTKKEIRSSSGSITSFNGNSKKHPFGSCLQCNSEIVDKGNFYGCSSYQKTGCGFTISKTILGKALSPEDIKMLLDNGETRLIEGFNRKNGQGTFKAVLSWDNESNKLVFKTPNPNIYKIPLNLLKPLTVFEPSEDDMMQQFLAIEKEALALKCPAKVVGVKHGPRITRYELLPNKGINIKNYNRYAANFQAALKAKRLNMQIPIPGSDLIGIETPNLHPYPVQLRGLLENEEFQAKKKDLSIPIGMDLLGNPYFADLADMPHILVAGTTGAGKSVCLNSLIISLLYSCTADKLKMMFIDPKQVELAVYEGMPHLFAPIVTDVNKAGKALDLLIQEMTRRYQMLQQAGVRNITAYNEKILAQDPNAKRMPYIVLVIDEFADLMMTTTDYNVETHVTRLSQLGRAAGVHMILATQRPTKQVISPIIKGNFPVRVAFAVAATSDSMTILDEPGAENLLGKGDMFFLPKDSSKIRLQSGYLSDQEIETVVNYLIHMYSPK